MIKVETRIVRICINKKYQANGVSRLSSNDTVQKEIKPITGTMKNKRIGQTMFVKVLNTLF